MSKSIGMKLFYHSPYPIRMILASLHGLILQNERYSSKTDKLVADALVRENWTASQWQEYNDETLSFILVHASKNVPYYRKQWEKRRRNGDNASVELIKNWPVLSKDTLRNQPQAFIADSVNLQSQIKVNTSGTTGKPLTLWMSNETVSQWYALFEARWRSWYGISRHDRWGILGGQLVTPYSQRKPPFWVWNAGMHQLYLSSYHLSSQNIPDYIEAIRRHGIIYLYGYASSLYSLAKISLEKKLDIPVLKTVISNAEPLYARQREVISKAFQCPVHDTYGISEYVCAASECFNGLLHLWPEVGYTEILDDFVDESLQNGKVGRLVCTGYLNYSMPLIRYDIGDRGFFPQDKNCACGRSLPILGGIEGRKDDVIITQDGRRIGRLDPVFKSELPIREAQIIQKTHNSILVLYVPASDCSKEDLNSLVDRLHERIGEMEIALEKVDQIPRTSNGKFRAVISEIKPK